ncbi:MAG TPA: hypothetical protein VMV77_05690 [Bacteroidales bacterium]|nr:hypothetical protein [Bacteroidales bacterium]
MIEAKPTLVDFGPDPSTQVVRIATNAAALYITAMPSWLTQFTLPYTISIAGNLGTISLSPREDTIEYYTPQYITIVDNVASPTETYYLPVMWTQDSQKILLKDIVNDFILVQSEDDYTYGLDRTVAMAYAKKGLQEMHYDHLQEVRYHEAVINDVNKVSMPLDALEYIRVFSVDECGYLHLLYVNDRINNAEAYLRNEDGFLMLDHEGYLLSGQGLTPTLNSPGSRSGSPYEIQWNYPAEYFDGASLAKGKFFGIKGGHANFNGEYKYDPVSKTFIFDNMLTDKVVIEYISDPLLDEKLSRKYGELRIHKFFRIALDNWLYWKAIERKRNVPAIEKRRAKMDYFIELKRARRRKGSNKIGELIQALHTDRGFSRW